MSITSLGRCNFFKNSLNQDLSNSILSGFSSLVVGLKKHEISTAQIPVNRHGAIYANPGIYHVATWMCRETEPIP